MRARIFLALMLVVTSLDASPRRRAVNKPSVDPASPETWLAQNAHVLLAKEPVPYIHDLAPLSDIVGDASIVGLGDGTHGTREFYTMKTRVIEFLAREMDFDLVGFEGPFPLMNRMNAYINGEPGDARALVHAMRTNNYLFFDVEEFVDLLEWMRQYNATRGNRRPLQIGGFDIFESYSAARDVVAYLRTVDAPAATTAETLYSCITETQMVVNGTCGAAADSVFNALASKESVYGATPAYHDALQSARTIVQTATPAGYERDEAMALNAEWLREHHSATKKAILWAHNAHIGKTDTAFIPWTPMGELLVRNHGDDYVAIGTLTAAGSLLQWDNRSLLPAVVTLPALQPDSLETDLRKHGAPFLLIPLRNAPAWLAAARPYNTAGTADEVRHTLALPPQFDAAIFIDTTTPLHDIPD
ncbi:MAG: erythromycin esterase family protein [Thermoanaerobaculia bacterium]